MQNFDSRWMLALRIGALLSHIHRMREDDQLKCLEELRKYPEWVEFYQDDDGKVDMHLTSEWVKLISDNQ